MKRSLLADFFRWSRDNCPVDYTVQQLTIADIHMPGSSQLSYTLRKFLLFWMITVEVQSVDEIASVEISASDQTLDT